MASYFTSARFKTWLLTFGFWTLLGASYALSAGLPQVYQHRPPRWVDQFTWYLISFWVWMLLVPLVAWLGRRTAARGWGRFFLVHIPAGLVVSLAQLLTLVSVFWLLRGPWSPAEGPFASYVRVEVVYSYQNALLAYWIVLAVLRGMESGRRLRDERLRSAHLETQLVQSQLQSLRMQLQPHFLFNTLNTISALALADPMQARLMISRLGDLLRLTLEERHAQKIPLARELEFVRSYLDIQRVRFRDRLETRIEASDEALRAEVPSMILQPLVENALRHGLQDKVARGNLHIAASREDEQLRVRVEDDGVGLRPGSGTEGVGLGNIRARLEMLFGAEAHVDLTPREGGGTCAELRFPFRLHVGQATT